VDVFQVSTELLRDTATFSGQLDAEASVMIKSETDGVVAEVRFDEGQTVTRGAVLFVLRDEEQKARLREAEATRALAAEVYDRINRLVTRDAASLAQKDRAVAELAVARARVELARLELDRTQIRAPFDGVLGVRLVDPGDRITDEIALVQIDAVDRLQVSFATSEQGVAFARTGAAVEARVLPYPGEVFPGEVFYVSPTLDPATRRVLLKAWIPNQDGRLRPGLFANVDLEIDRRDAAIQVPESAVVFDQRGAHVWRVREDGDNRTVERAPIEVGLRKDGRVEVTLGLQPGDTIVSAGTHKVSEGGRIQPKLPPPAGTAAREPPPSPEVGAGT
jgi:membrane fusion protein (multidrug efflux system)